MILIIRGHIRNSFENKDLYNWVQELYNIDYNLKIFIHTWNIYANNLSWKEREPDDRIVTTEIIKNYFGELNKLINHIIIDDDSKIELIGNLEGNINKGTMKLIGWKNYWYGKYKIIEHIHNINIDSNEIVINTRFDILDNTHYFDRNYFSFLYKNNIHTNFTKNVFIADWEFLGLDNIYIGNVNTMYKLIHYFFYFLDDILVKNPEILNHEFLVQRVNNILFD